MQAEAYLRDRKKARTRDMLVRHALRLFGKRGFGAVTVDEVAAAADVSRRTFFRYFPTKEAVIFPDRADRFDRFQAMLAERRRGETPFARVRRSLLALVDEYVENVDSVVALQRIIDGSPALLAHEQQLDLEWERAIAEALTARNTSAASQRRASIIAGALIGAIRVVLREWIDSRGELDLHTLGSDTLDLLERGFSRAN